METPNFLKTIKLYLKTNQSLSREQLDIILLIDTLYKNIPYDVAEFKRLNGHMDPSVIETEHEGITFLKIAKESKTVEEFKQDLNNYINIKYNYLGNQKTYEENMNLFKRHSLIASNVVKELLEKAKFPIEILKILQEDKQVKNTYDLYELLNLYKNSPSRKIKFEILRKIWIISLLSRINKNFLLEDVDFVTKEVFDVFKQGLGYAKLNSKFYYLWLNENNKVNFSNNKEEALSLYNKDMDNSKKLALNIYPMQVFEYTPHKTKFNTTILHTDIRNKLRNKQDLNYTSFIEKMIRKNLSFPNQVHDLVGIRLIVENETQIHQLIDQIETFLGGSSTRKKEKNHLNRFGKKKLGRHSSKDFYVWKAVYDITLPHPSISKIEKTLAITKENKVAQKELQKSLEYFKEHPQNFVVEVQLQDIDSYLLSIANGSTTNHDTLKINQIRSNSFYKLFPKEIYEKELADLRLNILSKKNEEVV